MKKKFVNTLLSASVIAAMMAGTFGGFVSQAAEEEASSDEPVTITYWGWDSNFYEPLMEAYSESHPNVTFEPTATEWGNMLTKAQQALASGSELPTIIPMDMTLIENWKEMDIMEDLTTYGLDVSKYNEIYMDAATTDDGKVIGLFENICPAGIAYKRDLAKEYLGTDDPAELQEMFSSYEAYVEKGKEVSEASNGEVFLFHSGQAVAEWLYFASEVPNVTDGTINMTEKMTDIMGKLVELRDAGAVDTYQNGTPEANATYAGENHIFYPCPDWALTYYIESNDPEGSGNWGLIKAPVGYTHGGTAMGITSASGDAEKQAAYDFITWCISDPEGAAVMRDKVGYISIDNEYTADSEFFKRSDEDFFGGQDISTLYYQDIIGQASIVTPSIYDNDIVNTRNDVAQQVMNDPEMTTEDAVAAAVEELTQLVGSEDVTIK